MPNYSFKNTVTGEVFDKTMKMAEREDFLAANPDVKQIFLTFPGLVDPVVAGTTKTSDGFNDLLKNMKKHHVGSTINAR